MKSKGGLHKDGQATRASYGIEKKLLKEYIIYIMKQKVLKYDVIFEEQSEGGYTVTTPTLPGCISEGDTFETAKENIADAIKLYVEDLAEDGEKVPDMSSSVFIGQVAISNPFVAQ